jgi:hypothetical protein
MASSKPVRTHSTVTLGEAELVGQGVDQGALEALTVGGVVVDHPRREHRLAGGDGEHTEHGEVRHGPVVPRLEEAGMEEVAGLRIGGEEPLEVGRVGGGQGDDGVVVGGESVGVGEVELVVRCRPEDLVGGGEPGAEP